MNIFIKKENMTDDIINQIMSIDKLFYNEYYDLNWYKKRYNKDNIAFCLYDDSKMIGYIVATGVKKELYYSFKNGKYDNDYYIDHNMFDNNSEYKYLSSVNILEEYRNQGYGTILLNTILDYYKYYNIIAITISDGGYKLLSKMLKCINAIDSNVFVFEKRKAYLIGENITLKYAEEKDLDAILDFQMNVINDMSRKEFFMPLTKEEFLYPINNNGRVALLYDNNIIIGLCVLTINPPSDIIDEYKLNDNIGVAILDSVMIKQEYRGSKLQKQVMNIIEEEAKEKKVKAIVATIHPDNVYSLNNFIDTDYDIINKIFIHNGERLILYKII